MRLRKLHFMSEEEVLAEYKAISAETRAHWKKQVAEVIQRERGCDFQKAMHILNGLLRVDRKKR